MLGCTTKEDGLKLQIKEAEGLYYPFSKNKGAHQTAWLPGS